MTHMIISVRSTLNYRTSDHFITSSVIITPIIAAVLLTTGCTTYYSVLIVRGCHKMADSGAD